MSTDFPTAAVGSSQAPTATVEKSFTASNTKFRHPPAPVPAGLITSAAVSGQLRYMGYTEAVTGMTTDPAKLVSSLNALRLVFEKNLSEVSVEYLWSQTSGESIALCRNKFLKTPADWKGTKVRAAGRWQSEQIKAIGGSPQALDPSEIYLALQNGTVDCTLSVTILAPSLKLEQVAPKVTFLRAFFTKTPGSTYKLNDAEHDSLRSAFVSALGPLQAEIRRGGAAGEVHTGRTSVKESRVQA